MKAKNWVLPGTVFLFMIVTASGVHAQAVINKASIGNTTITNKTSPWEIEGQTFTWNGVNVTVTRYPSNSLKKARIEIVSDATSDTIGIYNAAFTATSAVTNFPINFESTGLGPAPTTPPTWYYVQGSGSFVDNAPLNGILTTVGKINPNPVNNPTGWNQIGNTLLHNTAGCSCLTFSPTLGYKTYASSTFATQRGLRAEILLNLGNPSEAVRLIYLKVNNGPSPGTDDSVDQACDNAKEEECETLTPKAGFLCKVFGICPRCSGIRDFQKIEIIEKPDVPITKSE